MKAYFFLLALVGLSGCTTWALERSTLNHVESSTDLRYREIIDNLALIYANPDALPAYASIYTGAADINDNIKLTSQTIWTRTNPAAGYLTAFSTASGDLLGSRAEKGTWTLDPTVVPEKLRAMRAACRWVLFGPESLGADWQLLKRYEPPRFSVAGPGNPSGYLPGDPPGIHFDVLDRLASIPPGWLHREDRWSAVPKSACYWQGCHGKYVWVAPDGIEGLSKFLLVIQGIARVRYDTLYYPRPRTRKITKTIRIDPRNPNAPAENTPLNQLLSATVTLYVDDDGLLTSGDSKSAIPPKVRTDNVGTNSDLKAVISATAKSP